MAEMRPPATAKSPPKRASIWITIIVVGAAAAAIVVSCETPAVASTSKSFTTHQAAAINVNPTEVPPNNAGQAEPEAQVARDEFNIAQDRLLSLRLLSSAASSSANQLDAQQLVKGKQQQQHLNSLATILLGYSLSDCCPSWSVLLQDQNIQDELRQINRVAPKGKIQLKPADLLEELRQTFVNITELSIDGQPGDWEGEKYYKFYDLVQYYLRLVKLANNYLDEQANRNVTITTVPVTVKKSMPTDSDQSQQDRLFRRQLKTIASKLKRDPLASSFISELLETGKTSDTSDNNTISDIGSIDATIVNSDSSVRVNPNFEYYEDFLSSTQFGHNYANNISLIRESVLVFDQICQHLNQINLQSNFTRPSKKYYIIRKLAYQVYQIRNRLLKQVSFAILRNRQDIRRIFDKLESITTSRPYIRLLGDQFSQSPPGFATDVGQLTSLLDHYLANNMTQVTFYDRLSELPEEFTILGLTLAHDYETKEVPKLTRFDSSYYNRQNLAFSRELSGLKSANNSDTSGALVVEARNSNLSLLSKLFT